MCWMEVREEDGGGIVVDIHFEVLVVIAGAVGCGLILTLCVNTRIDHGADGWDSGSHHPTVRFDGLLFVTVSDEEDEISKVFVFESFESILVDAEECHLHESICGGVACRFLLRMLLKPWLGQGNHDFRALCVACSIQRMLEIFCLQLVICIALLQDVLHNAYLPKFDCGSQLILGGVQLWIDLDITVERLGDGSESDGIPG
mmetsp:Transcript_21548/g.59970  ORF Transcript_21548/g.59970 Transcript_21548/m.59970 type:complete len:202 (-) Transcript_21548:660-1265(-)